MPAGVVLFCSDVQRLAHFYEAVADLSPVHVEPGLTVLAGTHAEVVLHALPVRNADRTDTATAKAEAREDSHCKPYFPVPDLERTRILVIEHGGTMQPVEREFEHRGLRMCDAIDPEGNVIQFRVPQWRQ